jgi:hypothetical protein
MTPHIVHVKELDKSFPILAHNIFDAAVFVLGEQSPSWIRAVCSVQTTEKDTYEFKCTRHGDEVEFEFGE